MRLPTFTKTFLSRTQVITFLDKYSPEQFNILGMSASAGYNPDIVGIPFKGEKDARPLINGKNTYARVFIQKRKQSEQ